jgi:predicted metal-dependent peptidase
MSALPKQEAPNFQKPKGNERQRLMKARTTLVLNGPFFGLLALRLKLVEAPWIGTCGTDGKHHWYNPSYIAGLSDDECVGIWVHEILHVTNGHIWRRGGRDHGKWNWACDYAIDPVSKAAGYKVPNETINPTWQGWSAEQIYPHIPEDRSGEAPQPGDGEGDGQGQGNGKPKPGKGRGMPTKGQILDADPHDAQQQQAEWKQAIAAAAQVAKAQGKLPGNMEMYLDEMLAPRVDWKSVLRMLVQQTAKADFTWRLPSQRHQSRGMYLPRVHSEHIPPMVFGWDTSGSHYDKHTQESTAAEITEIITEVQPEKLWAVQFDDGIQQVIELEPGDVLKAHAKGGGGTDFRPVFQWIEEQGIEPACLVMMTDCMGSYPDEAPPYPVIWASTIQPEKLGHYTPPFGEVLFLDINE